MSFKNKYIKYKLKYLNLKQSGGEGLPIHINLFNAIESNNTQNQSVRPSVRILSPRFINDKLQYVYNLPNFNRYANAASYQNDYNNLITGLSNRSINDLSLDELELLAYFSNSMINTINSTLGRTGESTSNNSTSSQGSKDSKGDNGTDNNSTDNNSTGNNGKSTSSKGNDGKDNNGSKDSNSSKDSKDSKDSKNNNGSKDSNSTDEKLKDIKVVEESDEEKKLKEALIEEYNKNTKRNNALALLQKIKENSVVTKDELETALFTWLGLNRNNYPSAPTYENLHETFVSHMKNIV